MISVQLVPVQAVDDVWGEVSERVAAGLKKVSSGETAGDYWSACRSGSMFILLAFNETEIKGVTLWRLTRTGYFECAYIVGDNAETWMGPVCELAIAIAKNNGCDGIAGNGRTGWIRLMKKLFPTTKVVRQTYVVRCE